MVKQVRVHVVAPRHCSHHRSRHQALLDDARLLRRPLYPSHAVLGMHAAAGRAK